MSAFRKKIINLNYYYKEASEDSYSKSLYASNSFILNSIMYKHLYYALNLADLNGVILDLGCGDGPFLPTLNIFKKKIIGLDFSINMLMQAKYLTNFSKFPLKKVILLNSDALYLPFKSNSIDLIFCLEVFEHITDCKKLTEEIHRILKDKGQLIYSIPIMIGFSLLIRKFISKLIKFQEFDTYTIKELFLNGILKKPARERRHLYDNKKFHLTHKNFDWRILQIFINNKFKQKKVIYSPFPFLKRLNPTIIFKVVK